MNKVPFRKTQKKYHKRQSWWESMLEMFETEGRCASCGCYFESCPCGN